MFIMNIHTLGQPGTTISPDLGGVRDVVEEQATRIRKLERNVALLKEAAKWRANSEEEGEDKSLNDVEINEMKKMRRRRKSEGGSSHRRRSTSSQATSSCISSSSSVTSTSSASSSSGGNRRRK